MNTALIKNNQQLIEGAVRLIPINEGHKMGYSERYNETEEKIFARTGDILKVLNELFPDGYMDGQSRKQRRVRSDLSRRNEHL